MATRSTINRVTPTGIESIYCHWDGYPSHNGKILLEHYQNEQKIDELFKNGNLSILGREIGTKHNFDNRPEGECNFYGRDRGESDVGFRLFAKLEEIPLQQFNYVWNGKWNLLLSGHLIKLTEKMCED